MPRIASPRPAIIAVSQALHSLRKDSGVSLRHVARMTKITPSRLSALENGRRVDATTAAYLLGVIGVPITTMTQLVDIANRVDELDYFDPTGRDESILRAGFERMSTHVLEWSPMLFPEALRSTDYSRAIQGSGVPDLDIATQELVSARARVNSTDEEPAYTFLIGEAATRPDACSPSVLHKQIEEAATLSELLNISISVVPASFCPTGLVEPFTLYEDDEGTLAVSVKHHRGIAFFTDEKFVKAYTKTADWLHKVGTKSL